IVNLYQRGMASMKRLHEVMSTEPSITDSAADSSVREIKGEIEFRDLSFTYPEETEPVLTGINLHIQPGQTVAFVGNVGSGADRRSSDQCDSTANTALVDRLRAAGDVSVQSNTGREHRVRRSAGE